MRAARTEFTVGPQPPQESHRCPSPRSSRSSWIRHEEHFDQLWAELRAAAHRDPEKDTEYDSGRVFAHWDCDSLEIAEALVNALRRYMDRPEIVFLRLADYRNDKGSITYKDTRFAG